MFVVASPLTATAVPEVNRMGFNTVIEWITLNFVFQPPKYATSESVTLDFVDMVCLTMHIAAEFAHGKEHIGT
jgi:hypothetical protein